jgi:hypothetical protein
MTASLLRLAAVTAGVQGVAHAAMFISAKPKYGAAEIAVIKAMQTNLFFAGGTRSYWDLYFGYGLIAAGVCIVEAAMLWQLGGIAATNADPIRPIVWLLVVANIAHLGLLARYFMFVIPMAFDVLIAALLTWACIAVNHAR